MKKGVTQGYVYVLQSRTKKYPTLGKYNWDVCDPHNVDLLGTTLAHCRELTLKRIKSGGSRYVTPSSQDDYWMLMFHADSLFADGLHAEAKQIYDLAFTEDRYILPAQLSTVAKKMMSVGNDKAALAYYNHRVQMEKDFYEEPSACPFPQLEEAVRNGDIAPAYLALLKDRIDVREGRPQKYGTQRGPDGLCPLLDASRVNEWRKEVGMPPIEVK